MVCGSTQGIGLGCALEMAELGAEIILLARNETSLQRTLGQLSTAAGQQHRMVCADLSQPQAAAAALTSYLADSSPVHILINNTGGPPAGLAVDARPEDFLAAYQSHLITAQLLVLAVLPGMKAQQYGRIMNIISSSVLTPIAGLGVSNTTRGAVANWGKTLAAELAPFGITVNNILPGAIDTTRLRSLFLKKAELRGKSAEQVASDRMNAIPMKRFGTIQEIGAVVAFLATPAAAFVSGVNLPVDGAQAAVQY
ncbi:MAG: 3-oxoacyl-[acyl-carrier-protein] reductase FabG [Phycisphaerae bacterium]|nr:3-oxoacyl-[acyl-carrier-protein] reductase FabG [Phycisphaerae bacterium]